MIFLSTQACAPSAFFKICFSIAYHNCHINHWTTLRGVACLKFNVRNGRDVFNAFIQTIKKGAFTNSIDTDEMRITRRLIRVCAKCHVEQILGNLGQY